MFKINVKSCYCGSIWHMWQFPSKEEEQHTFRTTPQEHWWIWPECRRHTQVNN